jgi:hypothetical protein
MSGVEQIQIVMPKIALSFASIVGERCLGHGLRVRELSL